MPETRHGPEYYFHHALTRRLGRLSTVYQGNFDSGLTAKTRQMTPWQGKSRGARNMAFPGSKCGTRTRTKVKRICRDLVAKMAGPLHTGCSPRDGPPAVGCCAFRNASHVHVTPGWRNDGSASRRRIRQSPSGCASAIVSSAETSTMRRPGGTGPCRALPVGVEACRDASKRPSA